MCRSFWQKFRIKHALRGESFHVEPASPSVAQAAVEGERRSNEGRNGGVLRGIRFLVAPASAADDPWGAWSSLPPLRVAAKTDVVRLARALLLERKMRSRKMPILLEATCSRRHAYIMCKALAKAQQLSMLLSTEPSGISCMARVTKRHGPHTPMDEAWRPTVKGQKRTMDSKDIFQTKQMEPGGQHGHDHPCHGVEQRILEKQ
eukprot:symbB.v1.2.016885.t2/scaffold1299.1/size126157/7